MKKSLILSKFSCIFLLLFINFKGVPLFSQIYFFEDFESRIYPPDNTTLPPGWTQSFVSGSVNWEFQNGGHTKYPQFPYTRKPYPAYKGSYNALFQRETFSRPTTRLITPSIDLSYSSKPQLRFWHAQATRYYFNNYTNDELRVYYRIGLSGTWNLLSTYTSAVENWTERIINLPNDAKVANLYLAFEGRSMPGWGTCVDEISIIETDTIPKTVESITATTVSTASAGKGSLNVQLIRINIKVKGNLGTLVLDSLKVNYTGTNVTDVINNLKIYATSDSIYLSPTLVSTASLIGSSAKFYMNYTLPFGITYLWLACDVSPNATTNNIIDVVIPANGIKINGSYYPANVLNPPGNQKIVHSIFYDSFETDKGWILTGDFERATPRGLGGTRGNPDPNFALSGTRVLGNDLTINGDYPPNAPMATATSPVFNLKYFKNVRLQFKRWLNTDLIDFAMVQVSTNNGFTWNTVYQNNGYVVDKQWNEIEYNISNLVDRKENVRIRFTLGPTDGNWEFSGWNIDDFLLYGDSIIHDVGVSRWVTPTTNCGLSNETVRVYVHNYGSAVVNHSIPVAYSFNNGVTWVTENKNLNIPLNDSVLVTFTTPFNLSTAGTYNIRARTNWALDDFVANNEISTQIRSIPTYSLPNVQNFEGNQFWISGGDMCSWELGTPSGEIIHTPPSGSNAWKTNLFGYYDNYEVGYVESPCFNISDTSKVIVEMKINKAIETGDGAALYYTINNGVSWHLVPSHNYPWSWNWYNKTNIPILGGPGWDGISNEWLTAKQVLPAGVANQSQVKFRVVFKSNEENTNEGFAFDDFKLYKAPINIRVNSIPSHNSACEKVNPRKISFNITNNGIRSLIPANDKIVVGFKINNLPDVIDTITLPNVLHVNQSVTLSFNKSTHYLSPGIYQIKVYHVDPNKGFYPVSDQDTVTKTITIYPAPITGLAKEYATARLDTFTIRANIEPNVSYLWANANNNNLSTTSTLSNPPSGYIWLRMQYTTGYLCQTTDTFYMRKLIPDVGVVALKHPTDACELSANEILKWVIRNHGTDTLEVNDTLKITYRDHLLNSNTDTILLTKRFYPNDTIEHISKKIRPDLSLLNQAYTFRAFTSYKYDSTPVNDTLQVTVHTWGYPTVDLGANYTSAGYDTIVLSGYKTYLWSDGTKDSIYIARYIGYHKVTVTDNHDCPATDSVHINVVAHDLQPIALVSPKTACSLSNNETLKVWLKNVGTDTIQIGEQVNIRLTINNGTPIIENYTFTSYLYPYDTLTFQFPNLFNFSEIGTYNIKLFITLPGDIDNSNDTLYASIIHHGYPVFDLGPDRTVKALRDTINPGYNPLWTYLWHDNSTNQKFIATNTGKVRVKVTHIHSGCSSMDSVYLNFEIRNGTVASSNLPLEQCHGNISTVQVIFNNSGNINIPSGDTVILGIIANNILVKKDTIVLLHNLTPGANLIHNFTNLKNKLPVGAYTVKFFCQLRNDVDRSNDTLYKSITIHPTPYIVWEDEVNDTIITTPPYVLRGPSGPGYTYLWQNNSTNSLFTVNVSGLYHLTVTTPAGCVDRDTVYVQIFVPDGGITDILSVPSACQGDFNNATVVFKNLGTVVIPKGTPISFNCKVGTKPTKTDIVIANRNLNPNDTLMHTFKGLAPLMSIGNNTIKYFSKYTEDIRPQTDTATAVVTIYARPNVVLGGGYDTIYYLPGNELSPYLGNNFNYLWNTGATTEAIEIYVDGSYKVKATHKTTGCYNSDSVYVKVMYYDVAVTNIDLPENMCENSRDSVRVEITNVGNWPYDAGEDITVAYWGKNYANDYSTMRLTKKFNPGEKLYFRIGKLKENLSIGLNSLRFFPMVGIDVNHDNDTLNHVVTVHQNPVVSFGVGNDSVIILLGSSITCTLNKNNHSFLWNTGSTNNSIQPAKSGWYSVRATNTSTGCSAKDSLYVHVRIIDGTITQVESRNKICAYNLDTLQIVFKNNGNEPIPQGTVVTFAAKISTETLVSRNYILNEDLQENQSFNYLLTGLKGKLNKLNEPIKVFCSFNTDLVRTNDTFSYNVILYPRHNINEYVEICYGENYKGYTSTGTYIENYTNIYGCDSVRVINITVKEAPSFYLANGSKVLNGLYFPYNIILHLNRGDESDYNYLWSNGSSTKNLLVEYGGKYKVKVTHKTTACEVSDSIILNQKVAYDLSVSALSEIQDKCQGASNTLVAEIANSNKTYIPSGSVANLTLSVNNRTIRTVNVPFSENFAKNARMIYNFGNIADNLLVGNNNIRVTCEIPNDTFSTNNSKSRTVLIHQDVNVELAGGNDTVYFTSNTYTLDAGIGYDTYLWSNNTSGRFLIVNQSGKYWVKVSKSGCVGSDTVVVIRRGNTFVDNLTDNAIKLYPIPVSDALYIELEVGNFVKPVVQILTVDGKIVYSLSNVEIYRKKLIRLPVDHLEKGTYILRLNDINIKTSRLIVVQ